MAASITVTQDIRRVELELRTLGARGASGSDGAGAIVEITGIVATASELPAASGYAAIFFLARDTGVIYYSDGTDWIAVSITYTGIPGWEIVEDLPVDPDPDILYFVPEPA